MSNSKPTLKAAAGVALSVILSACTDIALQTVNLPSYLASDLQAQRGLAYGSEDHQKLDLYLPGEGTNARRQLIVFVYGGAWTSGSRGDYYFVADALTAAGYAVAIPDYIKYPQGIFPSFVADVAQSLSWLSANAARYTQVDEFVLMGHSAGAHTAALLVTDGSYFDEFNFDASRIGAFIGLAGPYGFRPDEEKYRRIFAGLDDYDQMRPLSFVSGAEPPMLLLHGSDDTTVLPRHSEKFAARTQEQGGKAEAHIYEGSGHVSPVLALSRLPIGDERIRTDIFDFLERLTLEDMATDAR